ncbi:MAG TPA: 2-hydroxyacid dehydrogenase [Dehalococcoidia bacterium]|jgi:phosphoglycerate dehydrogenase-like enzyme|nr:2-hydroxyacid dehydrogenase [Dehalococcoidia bacterium]MDP7513591.1 2-hydroxyacid dehydrogenase [Dehalococcoidia bacterium]HCV28453.1 lactate dehydrogenase [Dehalococcoidia bacterium]HJM54265.1 2-hydroxyacid dehydrogenase [Dehalococcoidia bacterium]
MALPQVAVIGPNDSRTQAVVERYNMLAGQYGGAVQVRWIDNASGDDSVLEGAQEAIAVIPAGPRAITTELALKLPNLRLIQTTSAGTDYLDKTALGESGVLVANNGGGNSVAVAEHAIALMISVYRKMNLQLTSTRAGTWMAGVTGEQDEYHNLVDKTVGIVGLGRIGSRVARRLRGWECDIIYSDVVAIPDDVEKETRARRVELDELLATSDLITLHVPLDRSTHHMISTRELELMKPTAILINACRGPVVDEAALTVALRSGQIFGAGLDVTEQEPTPTDNLLLTMDNVVVTPHLASLSEESGIRSTDFAMANVSRLARGEGLESIVHPV